MEVRYENMSRYEKKWKVKKKRIGYRALELTAPTPDTPRPTL